MDEFEANENGAAVVCEDVENHVYFELQSTLTISEDTLRKIKIPGDDSSLFWAVSMAFLLPVRNNDRLFSDRFVRLFGSIPDRNYVEHVQKLVNSKNTFEMVYSDMLLIDLVTVIFCNRTADELLNLEVEHLHRVKVNDFSHPINEVFIKNKLSNERYKSQIEDLTQLNADGSNKDSIDRSSIKSFNSYVLGTELNIRAIEKLLNCHISVCPIDEDAKLTITKNNVNIFQFNTNRTHYEFGLIRAELVMETLKGKNHKLAIDYIDFGVDNIGFQDENGQTLLHIASLNGLESVVQALINIGADLEAVNVRKKTALHVAISHGHHEVTKALLENGANVNNLTLGETALHMAVAQNDPKSVQILIDNKTDVNIKDKYGRSPLHLATQIGNVSVIDMLLARQCDVNGSVENVGQTPLHFAVLFNYHEVVERLVRNGALMDVRDKNGWTPFHVAVLNGCRNSVEILIENGVDIDCQTGNSRKTALHLAAVKGHFHMMKVLVEAGAKVNARGVKRETPLHSAIINTCGSNIIEYLLLNGADINSTYEGGFTALHLAVLKGHLQSVKELLKCCQNVNTKSDNGDSPLRAAVCNGQLEVVEMLLRNGGNVFARNQFDSVLHQAVGNVDILKLILAEIKNKLDGDAAQLRSAMNAIDENENTPLMWAVRLGNLSSIKCLLECYETDVNRQNLNGWTALHWAAEGGLLEVVILLVYKKTDAEIKDKNGETAFDLARHKISQGEMFAAIADLVVSGSSDDAPLNCFQHFLSMFNSLFKRQSKYMNS